MATRQHRSPWTCGLCGFMVLLGSVGCNPGVSMDSLDWVHVTPRNVDLRGRYEAYITGEHQQELDSAHLHVTLTLLRDGSFVIDSPARLPMLPAELTDLASVLHRQSGRWEATQGSDGFWHLDLKGSGGEWLFILSGSAPAYTVYQYYGDPDEGDVLGWNKVAGEEAAGPARLVEAREPAPTLTNQPTRPRVRVDLRRHAVVLALMFLGLGGIFIGSVIPAVIVAKRHRSRPAGLRVLLTIWCGAASFAAGAPPTYVLGSILAGSGAALAAAIFVGVLAAALGAFVAWSLTTIIARTLWPGRGLA